GYPSLARTWTYPRARDGGRLRVAAALSQLPLHWRLRRQRFEWAFVMGGDESHRGIRRAIVSGAARVVAYAREPADYGERLTDPLPPPVGGHETARMLALLAPHARAAARDWLAARQLRAGSYVVIGVGARRAKKQPATDQIVRWATRLFDAYRLPTVFIWTPGAAVNGGYPGDDALAQTVIDCALPYVHPFRGPIREALGLIFH